MGAQRHVLLVLPVAWRDDPFEVGFVTDLRRQPYSFIRTETRTAEGDTELTLTTKQLGHKDGQDKFTYAYPGDAEVHLCRTTRSIDAIATEMCNEETGLINRRCADRLPRVKKKFVLYNRSPDSPQ
jgi:hypothetical protein